MKTRCLSITLAAMVVGLSGATARGIQDQIPEIPTARAMAAKSVTVTGCVGRGSAPDTYILTTVREGEATGKDTSKPETLLLSAAHIDISKHVGQRVSVTGMHAAASQAIWIAAATEVKPAIESTMTKTAAKVPAEFTVQSLMMISASCSQAGD